MADVIDVLRNNLVSEKDINSFLRSKVKTYEEIRVKKALTTEYTAQNWEIYQEKKHVSVLRKNKSHNKWFEDKVWAIMAKMGFKYLNGNNFKLPYTADPKIPGKWIDVFAADDECILVIECKSSSEEGKKKSFQVDINELNTIMKGSLALLKKMFSASHKIKFIFATNNITLSENDRQRLKEASIDHFNQDDINYYDQLIERIGKAARYQLLGRIFKDQEIPGMDYKVPAVRGKMGGYYYYSFSIEPEKLLKIGYILHRINIHDEDDGYQRMVTRPRLREIQEFINAEGFFPNSIIVNVNTRKNDPLNFDKLSCSHHSKISEPVILHLPRKYHSAFVIDGQHRLYGYANTEWKYKNSIPVVAFENLPAKEQVNLFIQINSKQKPVSKNLLTTIISDLMWNSDRYEEALVALKSKLLVMLGERDDSPLYRRVVLGDKAKSDLACITLDTIVIHGFNKTKFFAKINRGKLVDTGYLWVDPSREGSHDYKLMLDKCFSFFKTLFAYVKEKTEKIWNLGSGTGGFIAMNIGILSVIRVTDDILEFIKTYEETDIAVKRGNELAELTFRYLDPVLDYVNSLDVQKVSNFRKLGASAAGVENAVREFQKIIQDKHGEFNPQGLEQWIKDSSGRYNDFAKKLVETLEIGIRDKVFSVLQEPEKYGDRWWRDGVPTDIQKSAAAARIEQKSDEPDHNFLDLIDYKKIIERNWQLFKDVFSDPDIKTNKEKQLKWFDRLNEIRNKVSHPGRAKVTESEHGFLMSLNSWLPDMVGVSKILE